MAGLRPFEEVLTEHGSVVMRVCRALLGPTDAEDAWAETFLAALRAYPSLRPDSNVRGWLVTIAYRKSLDHVRATARRPIPTGRVPDLAALDDDPADVAPDGELWAAVAALPAKQRAAVVYRYVAGLPYAEIAGLVDTSAAAARRSAADGIANLRRHYREGTPS
jgi:RNA polymerase sigma factor (sigma-70 family)